MDISKAIKFIKTDIWRIRNRDLSGAHWFLVRLLRILILTLRGITEDRCQLRASALTFYSLLSVVPVLAMGFGIAKGFGFEKTLEKMLFENFQGQEQIVTQFVNFAHALLENVKGGLVAGIGLLILFFTIIKILSHIESAFNDIWGIKRPRSLGRKITDYLSLILIAPILFALSSAVSVVINSGAHLIVQRIALLEMVSPAIFFSLKLLPYCVIWILFIFVYMFIPNTKVNFRSGILAGIIAGTLYIILQWGYIKFQIGMSKYNAIYGSFAALPLFFIWLQYSWVIVLLGSEFAFAHQNVDTYEFEQDCLNVSRYFKRLLSLRIVHLLVQEFHDGGKFWDATRIAHELDTPIRLVQEILYELISAGIISEVNISENKGIAYQPARDTDTITIKYVLEALDQRGSHNIPVAQSEALETLAESLKEFGGLVEKSPANRLLKEI
ncbi:YihY/virulence factor BrkB family protein [bacterium]|nr:YihY/virulence factor BrkB family protein [bacterium]